MAIAATSLNRVNGVYERELAVTMRLVTNTDTLIFLDGSLDPYTNSSGGTMMTQNQATVDARIGSANYDIGHLVHRGSLIIILTFYPITVLLWVDRDVKGLNET